MLQTIYIIEATAELGDYPKNDDTELGLIEQDVNVIQQLLEKPSTVQHIGAVGFVEALESNIDTKVAYNLLEELDNFASSVMEGSAVTLDGEPITDLSSQELIDLLLDGIWKCNIQDQAIITITLEDNVE